MNQHSFQHICKLKNSPPKKYLEKITTYLSQCQHKPVTSKNEHSYICPLDCLLDLEPLSLPELRQLCNKLQISCGNSKTEMTLALTLKQMLHLDYPISQLLENNEEKPKLTPPPPEKDLLTIPPSTTNILNTLKLHQPKKIENENDFDLDLNFDK